MIKTAHPKRSRVILAFSLITEAIMLAMIAVLVCNVIRLWRVNRYSQNIWFDHNYFMKDYTSQGSVTGEYPSQYREEIRLISVPRLSQEEFPNGCEAVSAVMLLRHRGYSISIADFIDNHLECGDVTLKWGCRYGPDPRQQYAGNPRSKRGGWGCFSPVIVNALSRVLDSNNYARNLTGTNFSDIVHTYTDRDIPVAVWVTTDMQQVRQVYQWHSYDNSEVYLYPTNQHCMVLIGHNEDSYYFNDPRHPEETITYPKDQVEASYNSMGRQAVVILEREQNPSNRS